LEGKLIQDLKSEMLPVAPPVTVVGLTFLGIQMVDWVYILTALYTLVQLIRIIPKTAGCFLCFTGNRFSCDNRCKR
jgi:hypothetical protein